MTQTLNLPLFEVLERFDGGVGVSNAGQHRVVRTRPDPACPARVLTDVIQRGEQYIVRCPFCDDRHRHLYLNYRYGLPDPQTGRPNYSLCYCHRKKCHKNPTNRAILQARTAIPLGRRVRSPVPRPISQTNTNNSTEYSPPPIAELPLFTELVDALPEDHTAVRYLRDRNFDPAELARLWDVRFASVWSPTRASNRIVIPIHRPTRLFDIAGETNPVILAGWQARFVGVPDAGTPKYLFPGNFSKSKVLYGLTEAVNSTGPVYLCEGPTDVWRVGPGAVAPFGKDLSRDQQLLLIHHFAGRPIVVMFDPDAAEAANQVVHDLRGVRGLSDDENRVVLGQLPSGKDPADCTPEEIWASAAVALDTPVENVIPRYSEGALND